MINSEISMIKIRAREIAKQVLRCCGRRLRRSVDATAALYSIYCEKQRINQWIMNYLPKNLSKV